MTTDLMVNHAAGLAAKYFGKSSRTLVINASTNNPEAGAMVISMFSRRMGGWANPLGSLLANCYLMYIVGLIWVLTIMCISRNWADLKTLIKLLKSECKLISWHVTMALLTFAAGTAALVLMQGGLEALTSRNIDKITQLTIKSATQTIITPSTDIAMWLAVTIIGAAIVLFIVADHKLKKKRPNLFIDIDCTGHGSSIVALLAGTAGLILTCWFMNILFLAWTTIYGEALSGILGKTVFTGIHYFLGALITSLPELRVATANYRKLTAPDLNTALGSASYSNFTNLVICFLGLIAFVLMTTVFGYTMPWE